MIDTFWKIKKEVRGQAHWILFMIAIVFIMSCPPIPTQEVCSNMFQQNKKVSKTQNKTKGTQPKATPPAALGLVLGLGPCPKNKTIGVWLTQNLW